MTLERSFLAVYSICTLATLQTLWRRVIFLTQMWRFCILSGIVLGTLYLVRVFQEAELVAVFVFLFVCSVD